MNYEEIVCDANNLYRAYKVSVKSSKWKESTQRFMMNFLRYIFEIQDDLINRTLQNGPTQEFELHERGRIRPITSIQIRDRIVRHTLCDEVLLPEVKKHIIYDNCASIKGRGISQQRKRFEIHLHKYYQLYGNDGWILFGDFSKFYDNIIHEIAKRELLKLFDDDEFIDWLLTLIFKGFQIDVSYMSDEEYEILSINWSIETFQRTSLLAKNGWKSPSISEISYHKLLGFTIRIRLTIMSSMCVSRSFMEGTWMIGTS